MTTVLISQSDYIPWRGYFDLIAAADVFILLDNVQYTRQDWRNRNRIKTTYGISWLTIPVQRVGLSKRINETIVADRLWAEKHWRRLEPAYRLAKCFAEASDVLWPLYQKAAGLSLLSEINRLFLDALCVFLDIKTSIHWSTDFFSLETLDGFDRNQRNLQLCTAVQATRYLSGPSARNYIDEAAVRESRHRDSLSGLWSVSRVPPASWGLRPSGLHRGSSVQHWKERA